MKRNALLTLCFTVFCIAALLTFAPTAAMAQTQEPATDDATATEEPATDDATAAEEPATDDATAAAEPAADTAAEPKKPRVFRGRLPNYYTKIVTETQRKEIYAIQIEYYDKLKALRAQIEAMSKERDARVQAVLSEEQLQDVQRIAAEAKALREKATP